MAENRNFDPVKFYRNRVRVFTDLSRESWSWIEENELFELLTLPQKKKYLTERSNKELKYQVKAAVIDKIKSIGVHKVKISTPLADLFIEEHMPLTQGSQPLAEDELGVPALHSKEPVLS